MLVRGGVGGQGWTFGKDFPEKMANDRASKAHSSGPIAGIGRLLEAHPPRAKISGVFTMTT